jgi:uncharacterized phage protein (TIGR02220 family)
MGKDPAFLFYTSDFLTGTMFMTNEQVGLYIRLLCAQHQHGGRIDTNVLRSQCDCITGGDTVFSKFMHDRSGSYNERLEEEIQKRRDKSAKASESVKKRWNKDTIASYDSNTNVLRSENENEIESVDVTETGIARIEKKETAIAIRNDYAAFVQMMQEVTGREFKGCEISQSQFAARIKDGYTMEDFRRAATNAAATDFHREKNLRYLTPEFITRPDKLETYRTDTPAGSLQDASRKINRTQTVGEVTQSTARAAAMIEAKRNQIT